MNGQTTNGQSEGPTANFKAGDFVRVIGNGKGTVWEFGKIADINSAGALIAYGSRTTPDSLRLYGASGRVDLSNLESLEGVPDCDLYLLSTGRFTAQELREMNSALVKQMLAERAAK